MTQDADSNSMSNEFRIINHKNLAFLLSPDTCGRGMTMLIVQICFLQCAGVIFPVTRNSLGHVLQVLRKNTSLLIHLLTPSQIHTPNILMNTSIHNNVFHAVFSNFYGQVVTGM